VSDAVASLTGVGGTVCVGAGSVTWGNKSPFLDHSVTVQGLSFSSALVSGGGPGPPAPIDGSIALVNGDPAVAPDHDYFGRPRRTTIDLGAVQVSP
jgi:hypothetical protein